MPVASRTAPVKKEEGRPATARADYFFTVAREKTRGLAASLLLREEAHHGGLLALGFAGRFLASRGLRLRLAKLWHRELGGRPRNLLFRHSHLLHHLDGLRDCTSEAGHRNNRVAKADVSNGRRCQQFVPVLRG